MTDFDADEPVKPLVPRKGNFWNSDRFVGWSGVVLALSAAFFPWYVFINEEKFGIYQSASSSAPAAATNREGRIDFKEDPKALAERPQVAIATKPADEIITGTVPAEETTESEEAAIPMLEQPLPSQPQEFRLMYVSKGRAMIEDNTGVYLVRVGDTLPDFSKVANFEERDGKWVIVTDNGSIYDVTGKRD